MQTDAVKYPSIGAGFSTVIKEEGAAGLLRGWAPTLIGYSFQGACKFGLYEFFKKYYADLVGEENFKNYKDLVFLSGSASAEFFADIALCPWEAVKVNVQTRPGFAKGLSDGMPKVIAEGGVGGLFKGLTPLWMRQIPYTMMKFGAFERVVEMLYANVMPKPKSECNKTEQLGVSFAAGYIAGVFCAVVSHPADNLVSKLNSKPGSTSGEIIAEMGWFNLFTRGLPLRIVMIGTLTGLQWGIYDGASPLPPPLLRARRPRRARERPSALRTRASPNRHADASPTRFTPQPTRSPSACPPRAPPPPPRRSKSSLAPYCFVLNSSLRAPSDATAPRRGGLRDGAHAGTRLDRRARGACKYFTSVHAHTYITWRVGRYGSSSSRARSSASVRSSSASWSAIALAAACSARSSRAPAPPRPSSPSSAPQRSSTSSTLSGVSRLAPPNTASSLPAMFCTTSPLWYTITVGHSRCGYLGTASVAGTRTNFVRGQRFAMATRHSASASEGASPACSIRTTTRHSSLASVTSLVHSAADMGRRSPKRRRAAASALSSARRCSRYAASARSSARSSSEELMRSCAAR